MLITIFDGYVDEPSVLGVPPYISPYIRLIAGVCRDTQVDYEYITVDQWRAGRRPRGEVLVAVGGAVVPGRYLRTYPASVKELLRLASEFRGVKILGGGLARFRQLTEGFDYYARRDVDALLYDLLVENFEGHRFHTLDEWNRWLMLGAEVVRQHPDYPEPLIVEIETSRGCPRYITGGCAFCIEPLYGRPVFRDEDDVIKEMRVLSELGVRNFRIGGQSCIYSYRGYGVGERDVVQPNVAALRTLFSGASRVPHRVLHVDNANPAVIASYPEESGKITEILVKYTTPGNVLSFGMESADPKVKEQNNLNATPEMVMEAIRMVNELGAERGENGMPLLLPGLNFICGLRGESRETYALNFRFLKEVLDSGLLLRRINIRQIASTRAKFRLKYKHECWKFRDAVRREIDSVMLKKIVPVGTVLREVFFELRKGNLTYGRQVGSYPLIVVLPYPSETGKYADVKVVGHGERSITAVHYPLDVNTASLKALQAIPGVGEKKAVRIIRERPYVKKEEVVNKFPELRDFI
ncbi:MAG: radical SAM protein [Euryarchaeota archaeon]|nr:radical SAM protein [Euryarchaeota archaeon]